jgi:hypothetical protein
MARSQSPRNRHCEGRSKDPAPIAPQPSLRGAQQGPGANRPATVIARSEAMARRQSPRNRHCEERSKDPAPIAPQPSLRGAQQGPGANRPATVIARSEATKQSRGRP